MTTQQPAGMQTLNDALFNLVKDGVVEEEEAMHKAIDRTGFKLMLDKARVPLSQH